MPTSRRHTSHAIRNRTAVKALSSAELAVTGIDCGGVLLKKTVIRWPIARDGSRFRILPLSQPYHRIRCMDLHPASRDQAAPGEIAFAAGGC